MPASAASLTGRVPAKHIMAARRRRPHGYRTRILPALAAGFIVHRAICTIAAAAPAIAGTGLDAFLVSPWGLLRNRPAAGA